jgi:hypothetical protein
MKTEAALNDISIDDYVDVQTAEYKLKHPQTGAPTGTVFVLAGPEYPARRKRELDRVRRVRQGIAKTGKMAFTDPAEEDVERTEQIAADIIDWRGLKINGQEVPFSKDAAAALLADPKRRWLRDQLDAALNERENFIAASNQS